MVTKARSSLGPSRRAVSAELKHRRRGDILAAALRLLAAQPYESISMSSVATAAGVAKGTSYLYFPTREALFLQLLTEHYLDWFDALDARLQQPVADAKDWVEWLAQDLAGRPMFLRLMALLHAVLERNVPVIEVIAFKRRLALRVAGSGAALERALQLPPTAGVRLLLWLQAIVPGLAQMAAPPAPLQAALHAAPDLSGFLIDFSTELRSLVLAVVAGLHVHSEACP
ncbi:MAG TPA: TetR family transcriptional regulator [Rhodanobacter sp.]